MNKKYLFSLALALSAVACAGCGPEEPDPNGDENGDGSVKYIWSSPSPHVPPTEFVDLSSNKGCQLDGDCVDGMFCYYGTCTWQCHADKPCADGMTCSPNGRCLKPSKLRDAGSDLEENKQSDVLPISMQVEFITKPASAIAVPMGATKAEVVIQTTTKHIENNKSTNPTGKMDYVVTPQTSAAKLENYTATDGLKSVEPVIQDNIATYTLEIDLTSDDLKAATMGEAGEKTIARLMTSLGEYIIGFAPMPSPTGLYEGGVVAEQLAGATLPIRMGIDVQMKDKNSRDFKDIDSITLYLPSSKTDLFSPENPASDGSAVWAKLEMSRKKASECRVETCSGDGDTCCWAAEYSTNDFVMPGSELVTADQMINRSIRVEIHDMDLKDGIAIGFVRDTFSGLYREIDDAGKPKWSKPVMEGDLFVTRSSGLKVAEQPSAVDASVKVYKEHTPDTEKLRALDAETAEPAYACEDNDIATLMEKATDNSCKSITTLANYQSNTNAEVCLEQAVKSMLEDTNRISKVIEELIKRDETSVKPVGGFNNIKEFLADCAKKDGICKDKPEMHCAVDLLGRAYLGKSNPQNDPEIEKNKVELLTNWHQLLRESYLGRQYAAWNSDIDVRESWLTTATAPAFIQSSSLETINNELLDEWEKNVLTAHHNVLKSQFTQTSLEVLTRMEANFDIRSKRDTVLMEYSQAWEGLSDTLALGLRRYNTLLTATKDRLAKAENLQSYIFDLYYVGLVESAINLLTYPCKDALGNDSGVCPDIVNCGGKDENGKTIVCNNSSLNATYGKNIYDNVSNVKALNQSFDSLVYMRDAEVVTSTSLDSASDKNSVLATRKGVAEKAVADARASRKEVFDKRDAEKINQETINATLSNNLDTLMTEMIALCGYPKDCNDASKEKCHPMTSALKCGFDIAESAVGNGNLEGTVSGTIDTNKDEKIDKDEEEAYIQKIGTTSIYAGVNNSEAAEIILAYRVAMEDVDIAVADHTATQNKIATIKSTCDNYAVKLNEWHMKRQDLMKQVKANIDVINQHYDNITEAERQKLQADIDALQSSLNASYAAYCGIKKDDKDNKVNVTQADIDNLYETNKTLKKDCTGGWNQLANSHYEDSKDRIYTIEDLQQVSMSFGYAGELALNAADAAASFFDGDGANIGAGVSKTIGAAAWTVAGAVQLGVDIAAASQEAKLEVDDREYEFESEAMDRIEELKVQQAELDFAKSMAIYDPEKNCTKGSENCHEIHECSCENGPLYTNYTMFYSETHCPTHVDITVDLSTGVSTTQKIGETDVTGILLPDNTFITLDTNNKPVKAYVSAERENGDITVNDYDVNGDEKSGYKFTAATGCKSATRYIKQGLEQWILTEQNAIDQLDEVNDTMRELFEISDTYERDLQDLEFKRLEYLKLAEDLNVKAQLVEKAKIAQLQAEKRYYAIVQRAEALKSQHKAASDRLQKLNNLYSTPASVFAYAASLEAVENKIDLAKERIYDYLSAVEYYAVRPFVDIRRATYLARSIEDIEKIVSNVQTLVDSCGGMTTKAVVELSAREKMGITMDYSDMTMGERFRYVMSKGNIPINSLTRYTVDSNVRDLLASGRDLRAGTFELKINEYANLAATCNAKIDNIAIQIVGENLIKEGQGEFVIPTMTLFYDGQTQLASCQANIEDIVSVLGGKTSYGKYSTFVVTPTKISPTAGLNTYGEENMHLSGKPVATTYTVFIDTTIGENAKINWDNVEDIRLKLTYTYQDLFPADSKCSTL